MSDSEERESRTFRYKDSMLRFSLLAVLLTCGAISVLVKGFLIMTAEREYWNAVDSLVIHEGIEVKPVRGNILSCDGQRLACNLPEYRMHMDFVALQESKADTLWHDSLGNETKTFNQLCQGLHDIFPEKTVDEFKAHLKEGYEKKSRYWAVVKQRVDYTTYMKCKALPIFNLKPGVGGFTEEKFMIRNRPYGSLASSTIGSTYKELKDGKAYSGLELAYDSLLKGTPGYKHRKKVLNRWVDIQDSAAINGYDVVTTIDVSMQDLAERSLIRELKAVNGYTGVAIVMEVATGDIKAIVNVDRDPETGKYVEGRNHAIADFIEPGSVFKTASFMVALEDKVITTNTMVDTGNGIMDMYGAKMRDHNWHRGGYQTISVPRVLQVSSNIGVSYLIDKNYHRTPEKFVEGLHKVGIAENLHLPFPEYMAPRVRMPKKDKHGIYTNWSNTALPWMSIGYETNVPPISVVTYYNAIANNGVMVKPRFVKRIERDGEVVREYPVEVLKKKICSEETLKDIQTMLEQVVSQGLGKTAGSRYFKVSGKTGTAQKTMNGHYDTGVMNYLLSFAGYFPSDDPQYSCIVCIHKAGLPASGGLMSGQVFHDIAEGIMAQKIKYPVKSSRDANSIFMPDVKDGNVMAADYVLSRLGYMTSGGWKGELPNGVPVWGRIRNDRESGTVQKTTMAPKSQMPNVVGMGARDAVYLLESRGLKVSVSGCGKVKKQSKEPGKPFQRGERITLELA